MRTRANKIANSINHLDTIEIIENNIFLLKVYNDAYIIYRNDYGNLHEHNPIPASIPQNVYKAILR